MWATAFCVAVGFGGAATPASGATQAGNKDMQELKIIAKAFWPYASARPGEMSRHGRPFSLPNAVCAPGPEGL